MISDRYIKQSQDELENYFKEKEIKNPSISIVNNTIVLESNIINLNVFNDLIIFIFCTYIFIHWYAQNGIVAIIGILISLYFLWVDFNCINKVIIDYGEKFISIDSRNVFKKISNPQENVYFKTISKFYVYDMTSSPGLRRHKIMIETKDEKKITLIDFGYSEQAEGFLNYLDKSIRS